MDERWGLGGAGEIPNLEVYDEGGTFVVLAMKGWVNEKVHDWQCL